MVRGAGPALVERSVCPEAQKQPGCRGPRHAEDNGWSAQVTTGPAGRGCRRGPLSFPDKAVNLTTTPTGLSPQRETGFSASPSSQLGWETLGWGEARVFHMPGGRGPGGPPASPRLPVTPPWRGPGTLRSRCTDRVPADARSQESAGERTRDRPPACGSRTPPRDPDTRPDVAPPRQAPHLEHTMCGENCSRFSGPCQHSSSSPERAHKGPFLQPQTAVHTAQRRLQMYRGGPLTGSPLGPEIPAQLTPDQPGSQRASRS